MKALLIEDNPADARLIREMLKEHMASTIEVRHVTRLDTALECLCEETFDVLLLDLGLPDSQGMETLVVTHKAWGCLPIVVLTGLDEELFALEVMRAGAQDYLVKGRFDSQLLVRTIRYAVKRKQAEDEIRRLNAELETRVAERTLQLQAANEELQKELLVRWQAEMALRESEIKHRDLSNSIPALLWATDALGVTTYHNRQWYEYTGQPLEAGFGDGWKNIVFPDDLGRVAERWSHSIRTGEDYSIEYRIRRASDGAYRWHSVQARLSRDGQGEPLGWFGTLVDIHDRKLAEAQIAHLASFPELNPTPLFETDSDGRITYLNPSLRRMFPTLEVEGLEHPLLRDWSSVASSVSADAAKAVLREVEVDGLVLLQHLYTPEPGVIRAYCLDITERKRAEEAILRSEMEAYQREQMRALAGKLSEAREQERKRVALDLHDDIGQLLAAIKMDLAWTKRHLTGANDDAKERLERSIEMIGDSARSLRRICSDLRPGILDDVGLPAAIEWRANEFASRTGIDCEVIVPSTQLLIDSGKSTAIFRIFEECLTNIMRHAEAKSVRVSLRAEDGDVFLSVQDDGVGFRESSVSNSMESLGLLGMKERAQACGGEVIVTSSPGHGTTVTIRVPNTQAVPMQSGVD